MQLRLIKTGGEVRIQYNNYLYSIIFFRQQTRRAAGFYSRNFPYDIDGRIIQGDYEERRER